MNGLAIYRQCCFMQCLRQRWMPEDSQRQVLGTGPELHRNHYLLHQIRRGRADNMATQDTVGLSMGNQLYHAFRVICCQRAATCCEREHAGFIRYAVGGQFLLRSAHCSDFRVRIDDGRYAVIVHFGLLACNTFHDHNAFFRTFVRQHRAAHYITDRIDMGRLGFTVAEGPDEARARMAAGAKFDVVLTDADTPIEDVAGARVIPLSSRRDAEAVPKSDRYALLDAIQRALRSGEAA